MGFLFVNLVQAREEREAAALEEGWTVVEHHKGRKKTTDVESGISVGGVALAAVERKQKKQYKDESLNFYRFQRREARRNGMLPFFQTVVLHTNCPWTKHVIDCITSQTFSLLVGTDYHAKSLKWYHDHLLYWRNS